MKHLFILTLCLVPFGPYFAQQAPFVDFSNYFRTFYKNNFRQLEFQPVLRYEASDNLTVYVDFKGDFKVYDGDQTIALSNQQVNYVLGDNILALNIGPTLFQYVDSQKKLLTTFADRYQISDSLLVYEDTRFNSLNVINGEKKTELYQVISNLEMPVGLGDNTLVFKDNGDYYKIFWRDSIYDFDVYARKIEFSCGRDIVCFNDPINRSFTVFDKGFYLDLEPIFAKKHAAGRGFVAYETIQGELWYYANGEKQKLSNFSPDFWQVTDDLVIWNENSFVYSLEKGVKRQLLNYIPQTYKMKNHTYVFKNFMGGVSVYDGREVRELTKQQQAEFDIYGNTVLVKLFNRSFLVYNEGKVYEP